MPYYAGDYYQGDAMTALARVGRIGTSLARRGAAYLASHPVATAAGAAALGAGAEALFSGGGAAVDEQGYPMRRRYRRMNVLNPRALRRAMRRVGGFAKFARKTMTFTKSHRLKKHRRR